MGPTSAAVAANTRRVRERRGLSTYQLSRALQEVGRPITPSAISKLERGERRVDVDDLMALAVVLGVSPSALLLPMDDSPNSSVEVTGAGAVSAEDAWDWIDGRRPLRVVHRDVGAALLEFQLYGRPPHRRGQAPRGENATYIDDVNRYLRELGFEPELMEDGMVRMVPRRTGRGD